MQGRSLLIRADGSSDLGMGHISRCIALAQSFKVKKLDVLFACREADIEVKRKINGAGFQVLNIEARAQDIFAEASAIAEIVNEINAQWLIIDHPHITIEHETRIHQNCSCGIVVIDGQFRNHRCDVLVNPNAFATTENCQHTVSSACQILAGYRYFILNDEYLEIPNTSANLQSGTDHCSILVSLGAADPENCTLEVCQTLAAADFGFHKPVFEIVVGLANSHRSSIADFIKNDVSGNFILHDAPENLVDLLRSCTLCVSAGGITLGEAAYLGKAIIGIAILENQSRTISCLAKSGALQASTTHRVAYESRNLLENSQKRVRLGERSRALVDGLGKQRIANTVCSASTTVG